MSPMSFPPVTKGSFEEVVSFLTEHDHFTIVSHVNPDGDAISSMASIGHLLHSLQKTYTYVHEAPIPEKYAFFIDGDRWNQYEDGMVCASNVICVDCASIDRLGSVRSLLASATQVLNIDHHVTNTGFGTHFCVMSGVASTTQVLYYIAQHVPVPITEALATTLYVGLLTDTGGFRYSNTDADVLSVAHHLVVCGAHPHRLAYRLLEQKTSEQLNLIAMALQQVHYSDDRKIAWLIVTEAQLAQAQEEDTDGLVHLPMAIADVQVSLLLKQKGEHEVKVSLRAKETVDVSRIAQRLGGGGHARAAGCTIHLTLPETIECVLREVRAHL